MIWNRIGSRTIKGLGMMQSNRSEGKGHDGKTMEPRGAQGGMTQNQASVFFSEHRFLEGLRGSKTSTDYILSPPSGNISERQCFYFTISNIPANASFRA